MNLVKMVPAKLIPCLAIIFSAVSAQVFNPLYTSTQLPKVSSRPIDISDLLDNRGFGQAPGEADFDGKQSTSAKFVILLEN